MNYRLLLPALVLTLAAAPAPLVVGSVRDQEGAPISGAVVASGGLRTTTAADGTFALAAPAGDDIRISCLYCLPLSVHVRADEPVVAIVQRFQALANAGPSARDLRALPYAQAESIVSLEPFTVLSDSRAVVPGPRISIRGASRNGGVIVDDGIPNYDVVANVSMLPTIPLFAMRTFTAAQPGEVAYYGDGAAGGVFSLGDAPLQGTDAFAVTGRDAAVSRGAATGWGGYAATASSSATGARERASGNLHAPLGLDSLDVSFLAAHAGLSPPGSAPISDGVTGFRAQFQRIRSSALRATFSADRAGYDTTFLSKPLIALWSDVAADVNLSSQTPIRAYADAGVRRSTGSYQASSLRIAGVISQAYLDIGAETRGDGYVARAGVGLYTMNYTGGNTGVALPMHAQAIAPSLFASYDLSPQWNLAVYAGGSFRLPTLLEAYALHPVAGPLAIDRYAQFAPTLTYTEGRRLKFSVTTMNESVTNLDAGTVRSAGGAVTWQIAPDVSLRAWTLYLNDATQPYEALLRFGKSYQSATPGSAWLTWDNPEGIRVDAIYRADLLDGQINRHLDGSISAPFAGGLRWFVGTEQRYDVRYVDAGVRFESQ